MQGAPDAFSLSLLSLPFIGLGAAMLALGVLIALVRGNELLRLAVGLLIAVTVPWVIGQAVVGSCTDLVIAESITRFYIGTVSLIGPAMLMVLLAISGLYERFRALLVIASLVALTSCIVTWTTDLMVAGVWETSWGFLYADAGPLNELHSNNFIVWPAIGAVLMVREQRKLVTEQWRFHMRRARILLPVALLGGVDVLLARGIGVYPFGFVAGAIAVWLGFTGIIKHDLLRSRGLDRLALYEVGLAAIMLLALLALYWPIANAPDEVRPWVAAFFMLPAVAITQLAIQLIRERAGIADRKMSSETDQAIEEFVGLTRVLRERSDLGLAVAKVLEEHAQMGETQLFLADNHRWNAVNAPASDAFSVDPRVERWLVDNRAPLFVDDLQTMQLGKMRDAVDTFVSELGGDMVAPLIEGEEVLGAIVSGRNTKRGVLSDIRLGAVEQVQAATVRALAFIELYEEAQEQAELARELEVASAVQKSRTPGQKSTMLADCALNSLFHPASKFSGDWWARHELTDGRILLAIGDVSGQGVHTALLSAAALGACETMHAIAGDDFAITKMFELLNGSILDAGRSEHAMSCFAAVIDKSRRKITFANAGHPVGYVCRVGGEQETGTQTELKALVARGTPLGIEEKPTFEIVTMELEPGDIVFVYTEALTASEDRDGRPFGDRRLQRVLRKQARAAGDRICEVVHEKMRDHIGESPIAADITLIALRIPS